MNDDPIVASVREAREKLAAAFGYDVHAVFADLRTREVRLGGRLIQQPRPTVEGPAPSGIASNVPTDVRSPATR
jgi:hypothetical protein